MKAYLERTTDPIPDGHVFVHNQVRPTFYGRDRASGAMGFRFWAQRPEDEPKLESCDCGHGWLPKQHYRVIRDGTACWPELKVKWSNIDASPDQLRWLWRIFKGTLVDVVGNEGEARAIALECYCEDIERWGYAMIEAAMDRMSEVVRCFHPDGSQVFDDNGFPVFKNVTVQ